MACVPLAIGAMVPLVAPHSAGAQPIPHWLVLLVVVPLLWLGIGGAVLALDRLLERFGL